MSETLRFPPVELPPEAEALRADVRRFLEDERRSGRFAPSFEGWGGFSPEFSRAMGERGWIGRTWPTAYGGQNRPPIERYVITEETLAAGAPVRAHWVADRQSGPTILRFGTEAQKRTYLPRIARGECFFCIGMSEPDSGSDLASIRTRARKVDGGWEIEGAKIWTSNAHRCHMMILFARTAAKSEDRHAGVSQFLVDLSAPGITVRPIINLADEHDFNEVVFDRVFVPDDHVVGEIGNGWNQVTSELGYERSGPERWLSSYGVLRDLIDAVGTEPDAKEAEALGRLVAHIATLRRMSISVADMLQQGAAPNVEAALVKDLGTTFEQEVPAVARRLVPQERRSAEFAAMLDRTTLWAPAFSIRGGTREMLRGIIARALGLR
ncbi:MAG TPA: acyl-CoA dehydrogenase family protein [Stellaceae bacterium]|nr:acyl-CoA dehydrogenase family protein [Stellaceae bacterium]